MHLSVTGRRSVTQLPTNQVEDTTISSCTDSEQTFRNKQSTPLNPRNTYAQRLQVLELSPLTLTEESDENVFEKTTRLENCSHQSNFTTSRSVSLPTICDRSPTKFPKERHAGQPRPGPIGCSYRHSIFFVPVTKSHGNDFSFPLSVAAIRDEQQQHLVWLDNISLLALSLSLTNVWRLPTFIYFNNPAESLIAYIILMTIIGLPLFVLELLLGQFGRTGVIKLWRAVPLFKGVGIAQLITGLYQTFYFPTLMTWALYSAILSIGGWVDCSSLSVPITCLCSAVENCTDYANVSIKESCFQSQIVEQEGWLVNYTLLPILAGVLTLITVCASFGAKVMKCCMVFSGVVSAFLFFASIIFTVINVNINTAATSFRLLSPTLEKFSHLEVWSGAMDQTLFSLVLGVGVLPSMSSSNRFSRDIMRDGIWIWMTNIVFGVISIIMAFAWIGQTEMNLVDVLNPNAFLFSVYYNLPSWLSSGLNFAVLFFAGLNSMIPLFYATLHNLAENLPVTKKSCLWWIICSFVCLFVGLVNVFGLSQLGHNGIVIWDQYVASKTVSSCYILFVIGWLHVIKGGRLKRDIEFMILRRISGFWNVCWAFPLFVLIATEIWGFFSSKVYGDCERSAWMEIVGWCFYALTLLTVFAVSVLIVLRQTEYGLVRKLNNSIVTDRKWGPNDTVLHAIWKRSVHRQVSCVTNQNKLENGLVQQKKWQSYSIDLNTAHDNHHGADQQQCTIGLTNRLNRRPNENEQQNNAFHF